MSALLSLGGALLVNSAGDVCSVNTGDNAFINAILVNVALQCSAIDALDCALTYFELINCATARRVLVQLRFDQATNLNACTT